jgi:hypothetical protein
VIERLLVEALFERVVGRRKLSADIGIGGRRFRVLAGR